MEIIFGGLVEFKDEKEFSDFIETIKKEDALRLIEMALTFGVKSGQFNLKEGFALYKCLSKIKEQ